MVIFVGDEPSKLNEDPEVAFVGSKSYPTLMKWINSFNLHDYRVVNSHKEELLKHIRLAYFRGAVVIALGNKASERLESVQVNHFKLPHPSPRNRLLNDPNYVDSELEKCKNYIKGLE